jgi:DNA (cytosine-5)-methyltransferase 1
LDLFSGIGGFSLGLERAGMRTVAFCEINQFCRRVLEKHWPNVPIYTDVRELTAARLRADGIECDVICGGFPCQDISVAGQGAGLAGERSGLWREYARLIGELRPRFVIVENVAALLGRGLGDVLRDLASLGYDTEWHCIPASALGFEHDRDRIWIVAHAHGVWELQPKGRKRKVGRRIGDGASADAANADGTRRAGGGASRADGSDVGVLAPRLRSAIDTADAPSREHWNHQPVLGRGLHGVPNRLDRIGALGNAVIPQIPELIGRAIMETA